MLDKQQLRRDLLALGLLALATFLGFALCTYNPADPPSNSVYPPGTSFATS